MKLKSSQRWAIGAITLTVLIACSPSTPPAEPAQQSPRPPTASGASPVPAAPASASKPTEMAQPLGYAGEWAFAETDCGQATKTFRMTADTIDMRLGERRCAVKSISEDHPTGRSMIYNIAASCLIDGRPSETTIKLDFGASDTVMQFQIGAEEPLRLVRCPAP